MTGREMIIFILENKIEDEIVIKDGIFIGFMDEDEAAVRFNVGVATVRTWYAMGKLSGVKIGDRLYFLRDVGDPRKDDKHE
jgi:hypothetical protein